MQNKPLSITVITLASFIGLALLMIIATWAIRRRSRNKLHDEAASFRADEILSGGHGPSDVEKGGGADLYGRGGGGDVLQKVEAAAVRRVPTNRSTATATTETFVHQPAYGYDKGAGYGPGGYELPKMHEQPPMVPPSHPFYDARDYAEHPHDAAPPPPPASRLSGPYLPNPFDTHAPGAAYPAFPAPVYDFAPVPPPSPSRDLVSQHALAQRAASPPFLTIDLHAAAPGLHAPVSPLQPADAVHAASPPPAESPRTLSPRRSSLLNGPATPKTPAGAADVKRQSSSHSRMLDPDMPPVPVAAPLPDEFGAPAPAAAAQPVQLKVGVLRSECGGLSNRFQQVVNA